MSVFYDVPHKWDLAISDGTTERGYIIYHAWKGGDSVGVPEKAVHSYSPTFVPRTNTEGNYGDDSEDFFLTWSQNDWSLGEQRKYQSRGNEPTRRYWRGTNVDMTEPGRVTMRRNTDALALAANMSSATRGYENELFFATSTNLYSIPKDGAIDDLGAHGLTAAPEIFGMTSDTRRVFMTGSGGVGVRSWEPTAFATFSATACQALAFLNNVLYGYDTANSKLIRYSSAGVASDVFQFKQADGGAIGNGASLKPFGGKLLIYIFGDFPASLWIYDGIGVSKLLELPPNFDAYDIAIMSGVVYMSGQFARVGAAAATEYRNAIIYYNSGQMGVLWQADTFTTSLVKTSVSDFESGLVFNDPATSSLMFYNPAEGGVHTIGSLPNLASSTRMASSQFYVFVGSIDDEAYLYPEANLTVSTATVTSSLVDFNSHLDKLFRGIKIEFDDGGGTSTVDIAYRIGDVDGAYTTLQADAVSGTEYALGSVGSAITGRSISVKITLNKGTSTTGPTLKRIYVRAAPQIQQRHRGLYHLACSMTENGRDGGTDNSNAAIARTGKAMVQELKAFAEGGTLLRMKDALHEYTGTIERLEIVDRIAGPEPSYVVTLVGREV